MSVPRSTMPSVPNTDQPVAIVLSDEERDTGRLTPHNLFDAITNFHKDGIIVLHNAVDPAIIDGLNAKMMVDTNRLLAGQGKMHFA